MEKEEWRTINYNYPELSDYMVSSLGRIIAKNREGTDGRIFKESLITNRNRKAGTVLLTVQGKAKGFTVAQLVARTFLPNYSLEQDSVIHIDNDINNNKVSNLRWGTSSERYNATRGIKGIVAKKDGKTSFFKTLSECSRKLGMPQSNISACLSDKSPRKTAHGYSFERIYKDIDLSNKYILSKSVITNKHKNNEYKKTPTKRDYDQQSKSNKITGLKGERYVVEYEKSQLQGNKKLQSKVEQVSVTQGDGLGYDILSFNPDGSEKHIEVKTTTDSENIPFYISQNERQYAKENNSSYWLYRVYDINKEAKLEKYHGNLEQYFSFEPTDYLALKKEN